MKKRPPAANTDELALEVRGNLGAAIDKALPLLADLLLELVKRQAAAKDKKVKENGVGNLTATRA